MQHYRNVGGESGVVAYESGPDFLRVLFSDGSVYLYTYDATGRENVERMKQLASSGGGLNSYINRVVRKAYARKER